MSDRPSRDRYVDALRAVSLFVVVMWHWVFSVVAWTPTGPHLSNPIGTTHLFWLLTWVLQVMPVFFFVGGFVNSLSWHSAMDAGLGYRDYLGRRLRRLVGPTLFALGAGVLLRAALLMVVPNATWVGASIIALLSPLWFLSIYVVLVALTPVTSWLHERFGPADLVVLVGLIGAVDLLRFRFDVGWVAWANFGFVWIFVHQLGYDYRRLLRLNANAQIALALGGLIALGLLTNFGVYPRSMVGVPQESISNMGPPTACIAALGVFQVGLVLLLHPVGTRVLTRPRVGLAVAWMTANAMTVFLWHTWGYAVTWALLRLAGVPVPDTTDALWWLERPLFLVLPALCTVPFWWVFRRFDQGLPTVAMLRHSLSREGHA
jgi:hypothetical protein